MLWKMVAPTPLNSLQTSLLLPRCFTESLCSTLRLILSTGNTHTPTCAVLFWPWCCEHSFSGAKLSLLAHTTRGNYFYIFVYALADTQGKKKKKEKINANEKVLKWKLVMRYQMWSPVSCFHPQQSYCYWSFPFPSMGLAQAGPQDRHSASPLSPNQLTKSVLAQCRQVTS